jgi:hypothetical protein
MTRKLDAKQMAALEAEGEELTRWAETARFDGASGATGLELRLAMLKADLRRREADEITAAAITRAHDSGLSWDRIGLVLGRSGEAVRKRYAHIPRKLAT